MAELRCPNCDDLRDFEVVMLELPVSDRGSDRRVEFVVCSTCKTPVGAIDRDVHETVPKIKNALK